MNLARQSFCVLSPVGSDSCHDQAPAWLLGDVAETEKSSSVASVLVVNCFFYVVSRKVCQPSKLFPVLRDGDVEQHLSKLLGSFVFQLNTCNNTHGHVSVFSNALTESLVHSHRCGYVVLRTGALGARDLPHAAAVALWPAPLVNLANVARQSLFSLRST